MVEEGEMGLEAAFDDGVCVGQGRSAAGDVDGGSRGGGGEQKRSDVGLMRRRRAATAAAVWRKEESGHNGEFGGAVASLKFVGYMVLRICRDGPCPDPGLKLTRW